MREQTMFYDHEAGAVDKALLSTWIRGWAQTREVAPPVAVADGFYVAVNWPDQKARYVFAAITDTLRTLAQTITEPLVFLKVCCEAETLQAILPPRWVIQPQRYLMCCDSVMPVPAKELLQGYHLEILEHLALPTVQIRLGTGAIVAQGHVTGVDGIAIYDRIETHPGHRRLGLASQVMKALEMIATKQGWTRGILVATAEGRSLYETLGWKIRSGYTTAVIPAT